MFAPVGSVTVRPEIEDCALHAGADTSQQLHWVELLALVARMDHPPALSTKAVTLDEDWLVMPLPDVDDAMEPLPRTPWISGPPGEVTVDVPPRGGRGHVSPATDVEEVPFEVMIELMPVARPLNS